MDKPTDMDVLNELFTGEIHEFEPESDMEMDLRCCGSYAEAQARLARALDMVLEMSTRRVV